jgi:hypothetical protein
VAATAVRPRDDPAAVGRTTHTHSLACTCTCIKQYGTAFWVASWLYVLKVILCDDLALLNHTRVSHVTVSDLEFVVSMHCSELPWLVLLRAWWL